jgi:chromosome segregation ATPase
MKEETNLKIAELSQQISSLMSQLEECQVEKEAVQQKLALDINNAEGKGSILEKKIKELYNEMTTLKSEKEKWAEKAIKFQQNYEQISMNIQKLPSVETERQSIQLKNTMDELNMKKRKVKELEDKVKHLTEESKLIMAESKENLVLLNQEKISIHQKVKKLNADDKQECESSMRRQMAELADKLEKQECTIEELMVENSELKKRLNKSETDNLEFLRSKNDKIGYLQNLKIELNKLRDENSKYKLQLLKTRNAKGDKAYVV